MSHPRPRPFRHALLAVLLVGGATVTGPAASARPPAPAPMRVQEAPVITPLSWELPVTGYRITGEFGDTGSWSSAHTGLDFAVDEGTPIRAITSGVVTEATYDGAFGNKVVITTDDGTDLWYCHQAALAVEVGQRVVTGEVIGEVGMTGNTTGPHLHLEVHPGGGDPVDPAASLGAHRVEM